MIKSITYALMAGFCLVNFVSVSQADEYDKPESNTIENEIQKKAEENLASRKEAASFLYKVVTSRDTTSASKLEKLVREAIDVIGEESNYAASLQNVLDKKGKFPSEDIYGQLLKNESQKVHDDMIFEPLMEAPLAENFPSYTPVNEIMVKDYPVYRMAETNMSFASMGDNGAFFKLFFHIKNRDIEMTAPVQIDYIEPEGDDPEEAEMGFLYRTTRQGKIEDDGSVRVKDVPAISVVSIGLKGYRSDKKIRQAREKLLNWIEENSAYATKSGPMRVMGYNSPYVPENRQFFEVEIPIHYYPDGKKN